MFRASLYFFLLSICIYGLSAQAQDGWKAEVTFLDELMKKSPELTWLTGEVEATPDGQALANGTFPSEYYFGKKHVEFDRTINGILALKWIIDNNRASFVQNQPGPVQLSQERFDRLRAYVMNVFAQVSAATGLSEAEVLDAMYTNIVINDLGKVKSFVEKVKAQFGVTNVDHDKLLTEALEKDASVSPSFEKLPLSMQAVIIAGLKGEFNLGQFAQAENVPANLNKIKEMSAHALGYFLVHAVFDVAGAQGHMDPNGAKLMMNPVYDGYELSIRCLEQILEGKSVEEVYDYFLAERTKGLGLDIKTSEGRALARLVTMSRAYKAADAKKVIDAFNALPVQARQILITELNISGNGERPATLIYYAPALLQNALTANAYETGLFTLARLYQEARINIKDRKGPGVYTVFALDVANAAKTPDVLRNSEITFVTEGNDAKVKIEAARDRLDASRFEAFEGVRSNEGIAVIGIGGGSDVIQAAQLGEVLKAQGQKVDTVISIRTQKTTSQGLTNQVGEDRLVANHGGEIFPGVFIVTPQTTGSGRFVENIPAANFQNNYLIVDAQDGTLEPQINAALAHAEGKSGKIGTVIGVDTGGDSLFSVKSNVDVARATPDQDLRVLETLAGISGKKVLSAIVAPGVDVPANAQEVLSKAQAKFYQLTAAEVSLVMSNYGNWDFDGKSETNYGKTPFSWQLALNGNNGVQVIPIPTRLVTHKANPWNPFVRIESAMKGIFFMELGAHLQAIGSQVTVSAPAVENARTETREVVPVLSIFEEEERRELRDIPSLIEHLREKLSDHNSSYGVELAAVMIRSEADIAEATVEFIGSELRAILSSGELNGNYQKYLQAIQLLTAFSESAKTQYGQLTPETSSKMVQILSTIFEQIRPQIRMDNRTFNPQLSLGLFLSDLMAALLVNGVDYQQNKVHFDSVRNGWDATVEGNYKKTFLNRIVSAASPQAREVILNDYRHTMSGQGAPDTEAHFRLLDVRSRFNDFRFRR